MQANHKIYKIYIDRPVDETWQMLSDPKNQKRLLPASVPQDSVVLPPVLEPGARFTIRARLLGISREIAGEVLAMEADSLLECRQTDGPFAALVYRCKAAPFQGGALITEQIEYQLPDGVGMRLLNDFVLDRYLDSLFLHRQQAAKRLAESVYLAE